MVLGNGTMWCQAVVLFTFLGLSTAIIDLTHVCKNRRLGDVVRNPVDCQSYFICLRVPTLRYCDEGLYFDVDRKVCNWPESVNCQVEEDSELPKPVVATTPLPAQPLNNYNPDNDVVVWRSKFLAIDVDSGSLTNPMAKYDPDHIECRHFGAYFLPHPRNCSQYYICAYGHLHQHKCGRGTLWNYKRQECELSAEAECYAFEEGATPIPTLELTVCTAVHTANGIVWYPTVNMWQPTTTGSNHVEDELPSSSTPPSAPIPLSTPRIDDALLSCPSDRQIYLSHPTECHRYYICIIGMPVLTSCPQGLYWDQNAEVCDTADKVQCFQK